MHSLAGIDYQREPIVRLPNKSGTLPDIAGRIVAGSEEYASAGLNTLEGAQTGAILLFMEDGRFTKKVPFHTRCRSSVPPVIWIYSRTAAGLLNREEGKLTLHVSTSPAP